MDLIKQLKKIWPFHSRTGSQEFNRAVRTNHHHFRRHMNRDFLVLCSGPSVAAEREKLLKWIEENNPVVIGCNRLPEGFQPHYHLFVNRSRFRSHAPSAHPSSQIVISDQFESSFYEAVLGHRPHETLSFQNIYPGEKGRLIVDGEMIMGEGLTVGPVGAAMALVMGARSVFFAGLDGYALGKETHHYKETDDKEIAELIEAQKKTDQILVDLENEIKKRGGELSILTPTAHQTWQKLLS